MKLWEVLAANPTITYEELMELDVNSKLVFQPSFEEAFRMAKSDLINKFFLVHAYHGNDGDITRLETLYLLHLDDDDVKAEFVEYLNALPLVYAVRCFKYTRRSGFFAGYFMIRMPTDNVTHYIAELRALGLSDYPMVYVFTEAMLRYTKDCDEEIIKQLVELMEDYKKYDDWVDVIIPYGPDWLLDHFEDKVNDRQLLIAVYETALKVSESRLSHIADYINRHRSYENQLKAYVEYIDDIGGEAKNYGMIVMMLAGKLGKPLPDLELPQTTFQTWKSQVLSGQV